MFSLGIDVGTTKTAVVVTSEQGEVKWVKSVEHHAAVPCAAYKSEQDPHIHFAIVKELICQIDEELKRAVKSIGITGQMHGVVLWNGASVSNLVTWQDKRASAEQKLAVINQVCDGSLKDGFGFTTLAVDRDNLKAYTNCGTIHDYIAWLLVGAPSETKMDTTDAASWGLFDVFDGQWKKDIIEKLKIPTSILPSVCPCGSKYGCIGQDMAVELGLGKGIEVMVPMGDNQASVLGTAVCYDEELFITFGTGTQLSVVLSKETAHKVKESDRFELRPFVDGKVLAVAAPVCGGKSWEWLKDTVKSWMISIGVDLNVSDNELYERIDKLGLAELDAPDLPVFAPHFLGERWDPELKATIGSISLTNFHLGKVAASLALGLAHNLKDSFPEQCFVGKKVLVASGNAIRKSKCLQMAVTKTFNLPIRLTDSVEEAACGAARLSMSS